MDIEWEIAQRELKRCLTEEKSRAHSAFKLAQIKQKPNENLRIFILRYQDLHSAATGKTAAEDTDPTHIIRFLGMMTNSEIARKITQTQLLVQKLKANQYLLSRSKNILPLNCLCNIYYSHIHSHLQYGLLIWEGSVCKKVLTGLIKIQNQCLKLISPKTDCKDLYKNLQIL